MSLIVKCKCLECEKDYNAFIFPYKEGEKQIGFDLQNYPCPYCRSIKKGRYRTNGEKENIIIKQKVNSNFNF